MTMRRVCHTTRCTGPKGNKRTQAAGEVDPRRARPVSHPERNPSGQTCAISTLLHILTMSRGEYLRVVGIHSDGWVDREISLVCFPGQLHSQADFTRTHPKTRPANCTVFDGTVPYFDPCTLWYWKCTVFLSKHTSCKFMLESAY